MASCLGSHKRVLSCPHPVVCVQPPAQSPEPLATHAPAKEGKFMHGGKLELQVHCAKKGAQSNLVKITCFQLFGACCLVMSVMVTQLGGSSTCMINDSK
jgi:hypothetical protein